MNIPKGKINNCKEVKENDNGKRFRRSIRTKEN